LTLIGWSQSTDPPDGGVPDEVAHALARAFTSVARVTFPCSSVNAVATSVWSQLDADLIRALTAKASRGRIAAKLRGTPRDMVLMSTRRPETARRLFEDAGFPWWLQGQVVLLSRPDAPPPDVDDEAPLALFEEDWTGHAASLAPVGIEGIVRPGVDGDVAGLLTFTDAFDRIALGALETETRRAEFDWALLTEKAFTGR
jgi:hypothetical protein